MPFSFVYFFCLQRSLFLSFVISLVCITASRDRPGRSAMGRLQRAATARTADRKRTVHNLAMISPGRTRVMNNQKKIKKSTNILGHVVSRDGVSTDQPSSRASWITQSLPRKSTAALSWGLPGTPELRTRGQRSVLRGRHWMVGGWEGRAGGGGQVGEGSKGFDRLGCAERRGFWPRKDRGGDLLEEKGGS